MATTKPSRKSLMSIAVWLASFGACGSAMAGHYEPQYSGGTVHIVHFEHPPRTNPYTYSQWPIFPYVGYGGFGYTGEPGQGTNPNGSVTCSGQITIRFVWVKDNPADVAPSSAVLRVLSKAYAEGENISANSGIGTVGIPSNNTVTATTTLYNVVNNPGEEFTYALAPSASATLSNPPSVPLSQASAHVVVIGELTPVEISVYGSVQVDSERWVLPSQQVFISVAAGQYQLANHIWTILAKNPNEEEPEVYADFATEIEYGEGSPPVSRRLELVDYYWLSTSPYVPGFVLSEGNLIIFCAVKVLVNGQDIGTAYVKWNGFGKGVLPYFIALTSGLTSYGSIGGQEVVRSGRDATETEKEQYGMLFSSILEIDGRIEPIYHYAGVFAYAQLASPSRTWNGPAGPGTFVYSDALDNTWPYEYGGPVAWAGEDGEEYSTTDSPAQGLTDVVNYLVNDWFKMYYMYKADSPFYGLTSDYACLARADWTWFANDTRSNPSAVWPGPTGQTTTLTIPEPRDQIHWTVVVRNVPIGN